VRVGEARVATACGQMPEPVGGHGFCPKRPGFRLAARHMGQKP
jgi:hypothetical protein